MLSYVNYSKLAPRINQVDITHPLGQIGVLATQEISSQHKQSNIKDKNKTFPVKQDPTSL